MTSAANERTRFIKLISKVSTTRRPATEVTAAVARLLAALARSYPRRNDRLESDQADFIEAVD